MYNYNYSQGILSKGRVALTVSLVALLLFLTACASKENTNTNSSSDTSSSEAPTVLNFGFVGTDSPNGTEGWGFHTGIIQEELKKHGITEINIIPFQTGPDLNESVIGGRVDIGNSSETPAIIARSTGAQTRLLNFATVETNSLLVGRKGGANSIEELKGKKIAVVKGSVMYRFVVGVLKANKLENDVEVINMNSIPDTEAALSRGEIDAYSTVSSTYSIYKLIQDGYPLLAEAKEYPVLLGTSVVYVTDSYLGKFLDLPKVWNEALSKAYEDLKSKPDEYYKWLAEKTGTPEDIIKEIQPIESLSPEPLPNEGVERVKAAKDFLVEEKLVKKDFNVDDWVIE